MGAPIHLSLHQLELGDLKKRSDGAEIGKLLDAGCKPLWASDRIALGGMVVGSTGLPSPHWFARFEPSDFRSGETKNEFRRRMVADVAAYAAAGAGDDLPDRG